MTVSTCFAGLVLLVACSRADVLGSAPSLASRDLPVQAQVINQKSFNVLDNVLPPSQLNATSIFVPPGRSVASLKQKPFHVYDDAFYDVIGSNPTLSLIAQTSGDPLFHEAVVWYPPTDEVFFVQNAGAPAAGTGLNKSSIIQKISLAQTTALVSQGNGTVAVNVTRVDSPVVINPNGGTNYKGQILFTAEGQGDNTPPTLSLMNPYPPYNSTTLLNNYFGRQFNSLNDVAINPKNKDIYFTDVTYGYLQSFRPSPGLPNQVYRYNEKTGAVTVVADGMRLPNGITFSPDGSYAYVADTGSNQGFFGYNFSYPATLYRYPVRDDGTFGSQELFSFVDSGVPDGVHCDSKGNVYAGCGDGVHVWNPSGKLIGKIYLGETSANFQFAGQGRMVICAETKLYYATLAAAGADITNYDYN